MSIVSKAARKMRREISGFRRLRALTKAGFQTAEPNYLFLAPKSDRPAVIDIGCGFEAEFAVKWIKDFNAKALIVDPTLKHEPHLQRLVDAHKPNLTHLRQAVSKEETEITFHESIENESGSLHSDHINVEAQTTNSYTVRSTTIPALIAQLGSDAVEMLKVDIEGAEFDLFDGFDFSALANVRQLFVEFHHAQISSRDVSDTERLVAQFEANGFDAATYDDTNYLFINKRLA
ncbi:MAG: hypothetical protein Gyms2KO_14420 [Gymnodinialimonas sp.]